MNLQGIRSSVSLLGSQYSQYKERKREKESESGIVCRIRADGSRRGETGFPLTLSRSKLLKRWIVIAKERSYKGGNVCIFNEFARAFPGSESMGTLEETRFPCRIYGFFFSCSSFPVSRKEGKRERVEGIFQLVLQLLVSWSVLASLSSLFEMFFFISSFIVLLKSEMYK